MKYKLDGGSFTHTNQRRVFDADGNQVGTASIMRRSGWRGGPSYRFIPLEGIALRSTGGHGTVAEMLSSIKEAP